MNTQPKTQPTQDELGQFVSREVYYCVSQLISELSQDDSGKYIDSIMEFSSVPDYIESAYQHSAKSGKSGDYYYFEIPGTDHDYISGETELEAAISYCEDQDLDPYEYATEAYEYWLVSDWLATKLEEHGHPVTHDFLGMTIWGRPTSGQAILLDGVIESIYKEAA